MEFCCLGLCHPLSGNADGHAHQPLCPLRQIFHAVFRYVPPVLPLLCGLPQRHPQRKGPTVYLERRHGHGLPGADCLLSGLAPEPCQRAAAGGVASGLFFPAGAHQAGAGRAVLLPVPEGHFSQERCFHCRVRRALRPVRLGAGVSVERHVAGYLRMATSGGAGGSEAAAG